MIMLSYVVGFSEYHNAELQDLQDIMMSNDYVDATTILVKLNSLQRRIENIEGDGNCLFRAVADQLCHHPTHPVNMTHQELRRHTVHYMRKHKKALMVRKSVCIMLTVITTVCCILT